MEVIIEFQAIDLSAKGCLASILEQKIQHHVVALANPVILQL